MSTKPAYAGEAQLIRWADSLSAGRTLTLRLDEEGDLHPFKGIPAGQRMQIAVVLVNDDEEPIGPEAVKKNAARHKARTKKGVPERAEPAAPVVKAAPLRSNRAAVLCKENKDFQNWLCREYPDMWASYRIDGKEPAPHMANRTLKEVLGIFSKTELDTDPEAAARFDALRTDFELRDLVR